MSTTPTGADEIGIHSMMAVAWRRKWLIGSLVLLSLGVAFALLLLIHSRYTSSVTILLDPKGPEVVEVEGEFASRPVDSAKISSVVSIMQSSELLDRVVKGLLAKDPEFLKAAHPGAISRFWKLLAGGTTANEANSERARFAEASEVLRKAIKVEREGPTYLIRVEATMSEAEKAKLVAQAVADAYLEAQIRSKYDTARDTLKWVARQLEETSLALNKSQDAVELVRREYSLVETEHGTTSSSAQQAAEIDKQLVQMRAELSEKKTRVDLVDVTQSKGGDLEALPDVVNSTAIRKLNDRRTQVLSEIADLSRGLGARHPEALKADEERRSLEVQIAEETGRLITKVRSDYEAAVARERWLQDERKKVASLEARAAEGRDELRRAQSVAQVDRQIYDSLLSRYRELEQRLTKQTAEARIISPALVPMQPAFPRPLPFILVAFAVGIALGFSAALLCEHLDNSFATPAQIERSLNLPVIASVPKLNNGRSDRYLDLPTMVEHAKKHPFSPYSENLRSIAAALSDAESVEPQALQFTSPMPNEGKSTISACMAISAAMAGMRTILIDCDVRSPSLSKAFHCQGAIGVGEFLTSSPAFDDLVIRTDVPLLSIIPAGSVKAASTLITLQKLRQLVVSARAVADLVIVDSAPMEVASDSLMLSQIVDRTLLVVKWRSSERLVVERSVDRLRRAQGHLAGVVFNLIDFKEARKYGYWSKRYLREMRGYYATQHLAESGGTAPVQGRISDAIAAGAFCIGYLFLSSSLQ